MTSRKHYWINGTERVSFLQDLISQNVNNMAVNDICWGALLTPQGRILADFFLLAYRENCWWLDVDARVADDLLRQLYLYRMRRDVQIEEHDGHVVTSAEPLTNGVIDPRLPVMGWRCYQHDSNLRHGDTAQETEAHYCLRRIQNGVPEGPDALPMREAMLIDSGFVELNGLSLTKGCFVGQEVTARVYSRGLVKRRLVPVKADGELYIGDALFGKDGKEIGKVREIAGDGWGLAYVRRAALEEQMLTTQGLTVDAKIPSWFHWNPKDGQSN